jgi:hypothetical protein
MILPNLCPLLENVPAKEVSMPDPAEILPSLPSVDEPSFESPLDLLDEEERRELHDDLRSSRASDEAPRRPRETYA